VRNQWFFLKLIFGVLLTVFVILYPMLISIYVFLPLFVGFSGWMIIRGVDGAGVMYIVIPLIYLVNLEINLSLPLLMVVFATLFYYLALYKRVLIFKRCKFCVASLSVISIDLLYLGSLMLYDLLMDTSSIVIDKLLWYSLIADIVLAVL
jgi:hypothetical protein